MSAGMYPNCKGVDLSFPNLGSLKFGTNSSSSNLSARCRTKFEGFLDFCVKVSISVSKFMGKICLVLCSKIERIWKTFSKDRLFRARVKGILIRALGVSLKAISFTFFLRGVYFFPIRSELKDFLTGFFYLSFTFGYSLRTLINSFHDKSRRGKENLRDTLIFFIKLGFTSIGMKSLTRSDPLSAFDASLAFKLATYVLVRKFILQIRLSTYAKYFVLNHHLLSN